MPRKQGGKCGKNKCRRCTYEMQPGLRINTLNRMPGTCTQLQVVTTLPQEKQAGSGFQGIDRLRRTTYYRY